MTGPWDLRTRNHCSFLSMTEVHWEDEVTKKGNMGQRHYSGQLPIIQGPWCSHTLVHPLVP